MPGLTWLPVFSDAAPPAPPAVTAPFGLAWLPALAGAAGSAPTPPPTTTSLPSTAWLRVLAGGSAAPAPSPPAPPGRIGAGAWMLLCGGRVAPLPYDLFESIATFLRASVPLLGDYHSGLAPVDQERLGVYAQLLEVGENESIVSDGSSVTTGILQVSTFAKDRATSKRTGDAVRAALFDAPLTFTSGTLLYLRPLGPRRLIAASDPTVGGNNLFQDVRQFTYIVQPN